MKKQTLPLFFTLLLSILFSLSLCAGPLRSTLKKEPTTTAQKKKTFKKKVARVVLASRVAQPVQIAQATPLALLQPLHSPLLTSSQPKASLEMLKKLQKIRFMRQEI